MERIILFLRRSLFFALTSASMGIAMAETPGSGGQHGGGWLIVGEDGHALSVIDGVTFEPLVAFSFSSAIVDDPQFSLDGRYAYTVSNDGWVHKSDLYTGSETSSALVGSGARKMALSGDGKWLAIAGPEALTILSAENLTQAARHEINSKGAPHTSITAIHVNPDRESFILELEGAPRIWEVFYGANPPAMGFAHDWRMEGPVEQPTPFPIRKFTPRGRMSGFAFDATYEYILGALPEGGGMVVDLVIGLWEADLALPGQPLFQSGTLLYQGEEVLLAVPYRNTPLVSFLELKNWQELASIQVAGMSGHAAGIRQSPIFWIGMFPGPDADTVQRIDSRTFEVTAAFRPEPGTAVAHLAISGDGMRIWVGLARGESAVRVYDSLSLGQIARLPVSGVAGIFQIPGG